jgi:hypothetical protein
VNASCELASGHSVERRLGMSRRWVLAGVFLIACVFLGGFIGLVPAPSGVAVGIVGKQQRVSIDAATYGHAYESQAERVLLYFIYGGMLGLTAASLLMIVLRPRLRERPPVAL